MASSSGSSGLAKTMALLLGVASLGLAGFAAWITLAPGPSKNTRPAAPSPSSSSTPSAPRSVAAAPGRVEPRGGLVRISSAGMGRVTALPVKLNEKVVEGQLLLVLDDKDARARLTAAEAAAAAAKRERDAAPATAGRESLVRAEDLLYAAERALTHARIELDDASMASPPSSNIANLRRRVTDAQDRVRQEKTNLGNAMRNNTTAPGRGDMAVINARADAMLADQAWDRTRIRAPMAGSVLQINARVGELIAASPEQVVFSMGDVSRLRVRAEVDDTEVAKVRVGGAASVKSSAYPGQEYEGKVVEISPLLTIPRVSARSPRRPTDVEVMEVIIELDGNPNLLPGMRVETSFR